MIVVSIFVYNASFILLSVIVSQYILKKLAEFLYGKIIDSAQKLNTSGKYVGSGIESESSALLAIVAKKEDLLFVTKIVGISEFVVISLFFLVST